MSKFKTVALAVVAVGFASSCAHTETRAAIAGTDTKGAVRLDKELRDKCGDTSADAFFAYDSTSLSNSTSSRLDGIASCITTGALRDRKISVVGYTDPSGGAGYNKELGKQRADSVAMYLQNKGVPASHMNVYSRGEEGASPDPANWPADRMVDVTLMP